MRDSRRDDTARRTSSKPDIELVRRRHVLRLFFLKFDQSSLYLGCRFTEFSTTRLLALTFNPALFDRGREPLDMSRQRLNACDRILLLLLNHGGDHDGDAHGLSGFPAPPIVPL